MRVLHISCVTMHYRDAAQTFHSTLQAFCIGCFNKALLKHYSRTQNSQFTLVAEILSAQYFITSKNAKSMLLTLSFTCLHFLGCGDWVLFHWLDCCFVSGSYSENFHHRLMLSTKYFIARSETLQLSTHINSATFN